MKKKPTKKTQADGVRGTLWYFEPHELTIVGHDTDEQEHELCDHESNAFAAEQYTEYINYMRLNGIDKPIIFRRDGDRILVVEGRTTTRVARVVAPLWEQDRKAEGVKGEAAKLRIPAVVRRGTADELFCTVRATNRRRPGSESPVGDAQAMARLVNGGATKEQAAVRLGLPPARAKQLLAFLSLHPKIQRRVGVDVSLDAATKLAKLPQAEQMKQLAEIKTTGEKPTARNITNKVRGASGKASVETPAQKLKRISDVLSSLDVELKRINEEEVDDENEMAYAKCCDAITDIRAILKPPPNGERKTNRELYPEEFGA